ncbi:glycosyltransferase family 2 protein [Bacteroides cellulosilyticus]|jgi:group 2 glycosyl transferase|uniref:glycosyltransferase family 2 protein n=1 Tax=Bacteroides cellulosilyticus TaxID=246787 RepID=UPI001D07B954|nr:glycosyltransferase [Bacteroides cellulosilyticus]MCB6595433.1 glycosyltransferase [Bacteroides cellulosilyticus]
MDKEVEISKEEQLLMVTIRCITYNHEPYIRQCLEGFVMQKANFHFEAIVHDDASTDRTAAIIQEYAEKYPDIIKPIYETENQYSKNDGSLRRIMDAHMHGKYIAICEGDDYWIDPLKLQKQVDFLEGNPEYSMCYTDFLHYVQQTGERFCKPRTKKTVITLDDQLYEGNVVSTLTVLYRNSFVKDYADVISRAPSWAMGDYPIWIWLASKGPIYRMAEITSVYRVLQGSVSHSKDENKAFFFGLAGFEIAIYFCCLLKKKSFTVQLKREYYVLKFVISRFWRQADKLKYLFVNAYIK